MESDWKGSVEPNKGSWVAEGNSRMGWGKRDEPMGDGQREWVEDRKGTGWLGAGEGVGWGGREMVARKKGIYVRTCLEQKARERGRGKAVFI